MREGGTLELSEAGTRMLDYARALAAGDGERAQALAGALRSMGLTDAQALEQREEVAWAAAGGG